MKRNFLLLLMILFVSSCGVEDTKSNEELSLKNGQGDLHSTFNNQDFFVEFQGNIEHIHGLGYVGNQDAIFFAAHDGLKVYQNGKWFKAKEFNNDYMGFSPVDKGFYTSGHPGAEVDLRNPLGLSRSFDNGQSLEFLGFQGESDFHVMGVGYSNHHIYLLNEVENSKMTEGLFFSENAGVSWEKVQSANLSKDLFSLAVHPSIKGVIAATGKEGVFLSKDGGKSFTLLTSGLQGTSVFFSEESLWYGAYGSEAILVKYSITNGESTEIKLPKMKEDAVMYFAQNPRNKEELIFNTFKGDMFITSDGANTWLNIVKEDVIQE